MQRHTMLTLFVITLGLCAPLTAQTPGEVELSDIERLIGVVEGWGPCPEETQACSADLNEDGQVDATDLLLVLESW